MAQRTWRVDPVKNRELQIESGVDRNKLLGGKKTAGKRKLPHPKELSYPVAVNANETNGSRLLIKCFEYLPPRNEIVNDSMLKYARYDFTDEYGVPQVGGNPIRTYKNGRNADGGFEDVLFPTNVKMRNLGSSDRLSGTKSLYYVELPIPQDVNDSNTVTWGDNSMNILQLAGLAVTQGLFNRPLATFQQLRTMITDGMLDDASLTPELRNSLSTIIAGKAIDNLGGQIRPNQALGRLNGEILNSNLELLFDGVNLRSFPFSITFSPRNQKESMRVKHIIRAFKSSMAAKKKSNETGTGGIFLKAPDVFHLRYIHDGKDHPFLNSFKHCALTGMNVNYTNSGTFASYSDGTPVSIQVNLTFKELNPVYQEDYNGFNSNDNLGVGF